MSYQLVDTQPECPPRPFIPRTHAPYHLRIGPSTGFASLRLLELWQFRGLLSALAIRDIKLRYRQTALGASWVLLQPLIASGILAFVFGTVAGLTKPGGGSVFLFVMAGYIGWTVFSGTFTRSGQSVLQQSALISKVYFPPAHSARLGCYLCPAGHLRGHDALPFIGLSLRLPLRMADPHFTDMGGGSGDVRLWTRSGQRLFHCPLP
jgi:hypothetical protein